MHIAEEKHSRSNSYHTRKSIEHKINKKINKNQSTDVKRLELRLAQAEAQSSAFQERFALLEEKTRNLEVRHSELLEQNKSSIDEQSSAIEDKLKGYLDDSFEKLLKPTQHRLSQAISAELLRTDAIASIQRQLDHHCSSQKIVNDSFTTKLANSTSRLASFEVRYTAACTFNREQVEKLLTELRRQVDHQLAEQTTSNQEMIKEIRKIHQDMTTEIQQKCEVARTREDVEARKSLTKLLSRVGHFREQLDAHKRSTTAEFQLLSSSIQTNSQTIITLDNDHDISIAEIGRLKATLSPIVLTILAFEEDKDPNFWFLSIQKAVAETLKRVDFLGEGGEVGD